MNGNKNVKEIVIMLPIGSVVYLKEGSGKLMIVSRGPIIELDGVQQYFEYAACNFPQGLDVENTFYFNEENIDEVVFKGHMDDDEKRFQKLYKDWVEENKDTIKKGKVEGPLE